MARDPAYRRLDVDERRRRLLELGADLFTRHSYAELSMAAIAREAGISKALLYHYFPSKQAFFVATLEQRRRRAGAARRASTRRCRRWSSSPARSTRSSAGSRSNAEGYGKLLEGATTHAEVRELVDRCAAARAADPRRPRARRPPPPALRAAVHGWLWFMDGVLLDWLAHRDLERPQLLGPAARHPAGRRDGLRDARADRAPRRLADLLEVDDEDQRLVRARCPGSGSARRRRGRAGSRAAGGRRPSSRRRPGPSRG